MTIATADQLLEPRPIPLVVDVDGTLIKTDLLHETAMQFIASRPWDVWRLPLWLTGGKARLKRELARHVPLDVATLPLREETLARIRTAHGAGRPVYLASASERGLVERLAESIGGIDGVFGTSTGVNIAGARKAETLNAAFGEGGYDYIGDRSVDFGVWPSARRVLAVSHGASFTRRLRARWPDADVVAEARVAPRALLRALRPHQWAKNILVFLSLIAGHHFDMASFSATLVAFVCFCCAASGAYVVNDLLDLPNDRAHNSKRHRPFAAGDVPISYGVLMGPALMAAAFLLSLLLPWRFMLILAGYILLTLGYSFVLKRKVLIDVIALGGLYTIRVFGGVEAVAQNQSQWLLMFSLFLFSCLAAVKRCAELISRREAGKTPQGRGYREGDLNVLFALGAAAGFAAVLVVALYLSSPEVRVLYSHPVRMWLVCPLLLYWIGRVLILTSRNEMHHDPVIFALTDRVSWVTGAVGAAIIAVSI